MYQYVCSTKEALSGRRKGQPVTFDQHDQGRLKPKAERQQADLSLDQWTSAFHVYIGVYLQRRPEDLQNMLPYMIRRGSRDNLGTTACREYDRQFRSKQESCPSRHWGMEDMNCGCNISVSFPQPQQPTFQKAAMTSGEICHYFNKPRGC